MESKNHAISCFSCEIYQQASKKMAGESLTGLYSYDDWYNFWLMIWISAITGKKSHQQYHFTLGFIDCSQRYTILICIIVISHMG